MVLLFLIAALALAVLTFFAARQVRRDTLLEERLLGEAPPLPGPVLEPAYVPVPVRVARPS
ncbi:hypothetical protein [Deinococcus hopiensis]|uniref:Uncharacterized protein n=1 Tax=Deinococcus hopiensis KR-140 TaxID=695939 RepID=A0A1W1V7X3_9DEIO|nr:hypothetical protein [Deinococcus hopiensis]SMB89405.1 hypothetical protein SAMN00790413_00396 [Deinococcus hopiensis KR-140]